MGASLSERQLPVFRFLGSESGLEHSRGPIRTMAAKAPICCQMLSVHFKNLNNLHNLNNLNNPNNPQHSVDKALESLETLESLVEGTTP